MMAIHALTTTLAALSHSIDEHRLARATELQTAAPLFTPFAYVRSIENTISKIVADLLDPVGAHSQGPLFLKLFLGALGFQSFGDVSAQARVTVESPTTDGRRIDILIQDRTWVIGIENKPWAKDGNLQVADYLQFVGNLGFSLACLIYLTHDGRLPSVASIDQRACRKALDCGQLKLKSYGDVLKWLDACHEACRAERVRGFLSDLRDYLREEVMNTRVREPGNPVVESLLADDTRKFLPVALQIAQQKDALRDALLARLSSALRERLPHWEITGSPMTADDGIALRSPASEGWFFCVELDTGVGKWCYGLKRSEPDGRQSKVMSSLGTRLRQRFAGSEGPNDHWLMWLWFSDRTAHDLASYSQWEENVQPWIDMADGTMAANLAALALELHTAAVELSRA